MIYSYGTSTVYFLYCFFVRFRFTQCTVYFYDLRVHFKSELIQSTGTRSKFPVPYGRPWPTVQTTVRYEQNTCYISDAPDGPMTIAFQVKYFRTASFGFRSCLLRFHALS